MFRVPEGAAYVMKKLTDAGYQAYCVGGCVRDSLLGVEPKDWDVCTSAAPEEMQRVFAGNHVVETGLRHGTLTVMRNHEPYEVTTFRVDGDYTDHRHPDRVTFVTDVREDLARRDFTVNAMAWHPDTGVVDAFGGRGDLAKGLIRCVGDAQTRFGEDALRILRALRFASTYGFEIEENTARAVHELKHTLSGVAAERIRTELAKLLCGRGAGKILREYHDVITSILPELKPMVGFDQKTRWHKYDVWEHTVQAVENVPPVETLRLTMLMHDCGKPAAFTLDEDGVGHAWGHQEKSAELAGAMLERLKVDNATRDRVLLLVARHDVDVTAERRLLKRRLHQLGEEALRQLLAVQRADESSKGTMDPRDVDAYFDHITAALDALLAEQPCVTLRQLAVTGGDLLKAGLPKGPAVGRCLNHLLGMVIQETLPNEYDALLGEAKRWIRKEME